MNLQLNDVIVTSRDGQTSFMKSVFIRGSHVRMIMLPELLRQAPVLNPDTAERIRVSANNKKQTFNRKRKAGEPTKKLAKSTK